MTSPTTSDGSQPRQWNISNQTFIISASSRRVLAILNGCDPLLLQPGSVLQFGDPHGELVVTRVGVIAGEDDGVVCVEVEPQPGYNRASAGPGHPAERPRHLRLVPGQPPRSGRRRPGGD
jgi:hypothetical protein